MENETWNLVELPEGQKPIGVNGYSKLSMQVMEQLNVSREDL